MSDPEDAWFEQEGYKEKEVQEKCEHRWVGHFNPDTPNDPGEWIEYCDLCGMENPGSWVPEERTAMMDTINIEITCERGHHQIIKVDSALGREWAENLAGLLDGTSPMYIHPPGEESLIGKCGICSTKVKATILA